MITISSRPSSEATVASENQGQAGQQPQQQQPAPQRQVVVRRFQIAFQIDLFLMLDLIPFPFVMLMYKWLLPFLSSICPDFLL